MVQNFSFFLADGEKNKLVRLSLVSCLRGILIFVGKGEACPCSGLIGLTLND